MYSSRAIANFFIERGLREGVALDPMKLQKLTYFAHGWHWALRDRPLVNERVEAWTYGPVFPSLYHQLKSYGRRPVDDLIIFDRTRDTERIPIVRRDDLETRKILHQVWDVYHGFSGLELSHMAHQSGGPWARIWEGEAQRGRILGVDIPDDMIRDYFKKVGELDEVVSS